MALKDAGLNIVWIDKATFPRDKVCGDAIPSNVQRVLKSIDGSLNEKFLQHFTEKVQVEGCRFIAPDKTSFDLSFVTKGHAAKRLHFDHFLFNMAKECNSHVSFIGDASVESIVNSATDVTVRLADGKTIEGQVIVGCDGANSIVRKNLAQPFINKKENIAAVRAYYSNVADLEHKMLEIHIIKGYMPGYFWIFPLPENQSNVGFGMVNRFITNRRIDLKEALKEIIHKDKAISPRFSQATIDGVISGFGLPCGGRKNPISGQRFLLCGDAASLINPATGEGIGNAMISGRMAALHIINSFQANNFTQSFNVQYDNMVYSKLLGDLRIQHWLQRITADREWLINFALKHVSNNNWIRQKVRKFF